MVVQLKVDCENRSCHEKLPPHPVPTLQAEGEGREARRVTPQACSEVVVCAVKCCRRNIVHVTKKTKKNRNTT